MDPRKHLYNEGWESSTEEGYALFAEVEDVLRPIMERMSAQGYSLREVAHQMVSAAIMMEAETVLLRNMEARKREKHEPATPNP